MKFRWLILTCISFFLFCNPAYARKLLFWRFESNQNRLIFSTDQGVQPTAQLIANPTRLVIKLPGTILGRPTVNERLRGAITELRIGQSDPNTTSLVIELAPGYTMNPEGIRIRGISPTQWTVDLPNPERASFPAPSSSPYDQSRTNTQATLVSSAVPNTASKANTSSNSSSEGLKVTSSGLLIGLNGNASNKIEINRSRNKREIEMKLNGVDLPNNFPQGWNLNRYGISKIDIKKSQDSNATILTLNVDRNSPNWQATFIRSGGLVLWPEGGMNVLSQRGLDNNSGPIQPIGSSQSSLNNQSKTTIPSVSNNSKTIIESINITNNQLSVISNKRLQAKGSWNRINGVYELRLENTELSPQFKAPKLYSNGPLSRLRIWQPDSNTVVILAQPASGVQFSQLNQSRDRVVSVPLTRSNINIAVIPPSSSSVPINDNPFNNTPNQSSLPYNPSPPRRRPSNSRAVVVIDPGHGGKDPGAIGIRGIQEKRVVMSISAEVARILEQQGVQVRLTRNSDYFVSLQGRTTMANRMNADLFVSIHANSAGRSKPHVSGLETYYFSSGRNLAATIHRSVLRRVNVRDRKVRKARFYVLRKSAMPAVLVETGFLTGTEDAAKLSNSSYQKQMAEAIAFGIIEYIRSNKI